jgi:hypothetical protein
VSTLDSECRPLFPLIHFLLKSLELDAQLPAGTADKQPFQGH